MQGVQGAVLFVGVAIMITGTTAGFVFERIEGVRLVNGKRPTEGRLEVRKIGDWGTVCDDHFDDNAARVVCAQLGLENSGAITAAKPRAYFGQGSRPIVLDDVRCTGSEDAISDCGHRTYGTHNCRHGEDVGVVCGATEWTKWYNQDRPSGYGENERSIHIEESDKPCGGTTPIFVQVQVFEGGRWKYLLTADVLIHVGPVYGLVCKGTENWWLGGWGYPYAKNFQVRYTINKGGSVTRSPWINRDAEGAGGDYEWGFRKTDTKWTSEGTSIEFTTVPGSRARSHRGIDRYIHVGAKYGLLCNNEENAILGLGRCRDYRTRYSCYKRRDSNGDQYPPNSQIVFANQHINN